MRIVAAEQYTEHKGYGNEYEAIRVTLDKPFHEFRQTISSEGRYVERGGVYRAKCGDVVSYLYYDKPGNGYGGRVFEVIMADGTARRLKGPWSSRAGVVNRMFSDMPAILDVKDDFGNYFAVEIKALEKFGFKFKIVENSASDLQYDLIND
jgi:hypothetical protein